MRALSEVEVPNIKQESRRKVFGFYYHEKETR
jgi:hypothetical protein